MVHRPTQPQLLQPITEGDAARLRTGNSVSISVAMFAIKVEDGVAKMLLIKEFSTFDSDLKWKCSAGKMLPNETWVETAKRKFPLETGLTAKSFRFCYGGEFSSTTSSRHFKLFVLLTDFTGELSSNTDGKISKREWFSIEEAEKKINMAQQFAFPHIIEDAKMLSAPFAQALMNSY